MRTNRDFKPNWALLIIILIFTIVINTISTWFPSEDLGCMTDSECEEVQPSGKTLA